MCIRDRLERVPSDIRKAGGVARMADPTKITEIIESVSIPVMAKCRIGHFVEAQILESLDVDYIDESEVLTPADENNHINKTPFKVPFVCGARDLGEALRRIGEGAAMIRTKGEAGTGNIVEAVRHARSVLSKIKEIQGMDQSQLMAVARDLRSPFELVLDIKKQGKLPVVNFAAGGIATPADAALMMQLGVDGVFVGSGIFKSENPDIMANAIVKATTHFNNPNSFNVIINLLYIFIVYVYKRHIYKSIVKATTHFNNPNILADISRGLGTAMPGLDIKTIPIEEQLSTRGW